MSISSTSQPVTLYRENTVCTIRHGGLGVVCFLEFWSVYSLAVYNAPALSITVYRVFQTKWWRSCCLALVSWQSCTFKLYVCIVLVKWLKTFLLLQFVHSFCILASVYWIIKLDRMYVATVCDGFDELNMMNIRINNVCL